MADPESGRKLANYDILKLLEEENGGSLSSPGCRLNHTVALKVLLPNVAADRSRFERFQREAKDATSHCEFQHLAMIK